MPTLHSFFPTSTILRASQADRGVTQSGGTASQWNDLTGNAKHWTEVTNKPTTAGRLNGFPTLRFTAASSKKMTSFLTLVAPGTSPTLFYRIFRIVTWSGGGANDICFAGTTSAFITFMANASPKISQYNGATVNENAGVATGSWGRQIQSFANSTADYTKWGASNIAGGVSAGNTAEATSMQIAALGGSRFGDIEVFSDMAMVPGSDIANELINADKAVRAMFGGLVAV